MTLRMIELMQVPCGFQLPRSPRIGLDAGIFLPMRGISYLLSFAPTATFKLCMTNGWTTPLLAGYSLDRRMHKLCG